MRRSNTWASLLLVGVTSLWSLRHPQTALSAQSPADSVAGAAVAATVQDRPREAPAPERAKRPEVDLGRFGKVSELLQRHVDRKQVAGVVALVLHRGMPVYSAALGSADAGAGRPMSGDTIFRIASMTKPVTSVAVLMLAEEGRFALTDPVSRFLPEFGDARVLDLNGPGTVPATRPVTIHDLLTHTSGISYGFLAGDRLGPLYREARVCDGLAPADCTLAENIRRLAGLPLKHQPGAAWTYGLSTDVLGRLVEVVSGKPLDEFFRERIFSPLGMTDTDFTVPPAKRDRLAVLYHPGADKAIEEVRDDPARVGTVTFSPSLAYSRTGYFSGGAGLVSTAPDYARFLQMLLNKGEIDGKRLLKAETVERMTRNQIGDLKIPFGGHGSGFGYGFGVVTATEPAKEVASAGTFSWGGIYNTYFWADPAKDMVGLLLTQLYPSDHLAIRDDFKRLAYEAIANSPPDPQRPAQVRVSDITLHGDMDCFKVETPNATYVYGKKGAGFASILDKDGRDWVSYRPGDKARGEYRGLPKCGQPTKFFHCGYGYGQYRTANIFESRVTARADDHVRIESETADGKSACVWDFYPSHATMTLLRIDQPTYWFLYEGTPGGRLDPAMDFVIRPDGTRTTLDQPWSQAVPWVCFGAAETPIGFVCINHQQPEQGEVDSYVSWPFQREANGSFQDMTVFGFGRKGYKELIEHVPDLKRLPARFSIGFVEAADPDTAKAACEAIRRGPAPGEARRGEGSRDGIGRFLRLHWFEHGKEAGNPSSAHNRRFRVNAPEVVIHPTFAGRAEARGSGLLQILAEEDLRLLAGAELVCELWGGHPGTANRRVTLNGRTTYPIPAPGGDKQCTHLYPTIPLKVTDLVNGYNAIQFACDRGTTFWGHFIVDEACLRAELKPDHPDLRTARLDGFRATVRAAPASGRDAIELALDVPGEWLPAIARADFQAYYRGYDENGSGQAAGWHGFTKKREPVGWAASAEEAPFAAEWDLSMVPAQEDMAVRAVLHFKDRPDLVYVTPTTRGLKTRPGGDVRVILSKDMPEPFWSRAGKRKTCTIALDAEPAEVGRAELRVLIWDGGAGTVKDYFTLNGHPLSVARAGKHDVIYSRLDLDAKLLRKGPNRVEVLSDTEHHGLEVLMPGPALVVRVER
jgi:CubicO group peptidase (beta-lactamase class C family)